MPIPQPILKDNFKTLFWDKIELVRRLAHDEELAKCLLSASEDFKTYIPTESEMEKLPFSSIFPCYYTFETTQEIKSFITMKFKYKKSETAPVWKVGNITLFCFCHKDIVQTKYGVLRYDYMLQRVNDQIFNTTSSNWVGRMEFDEMEDIILDAKGNYVGVMVKYRNTELM